MMVLIHLKYHPIFNIGKFILQMMEIESLSNQCLSMETFIQFLNNLHNSQNHYQKVEKLSFLFYDFFILLFHHVSLVERWKGQKLFSKNGLHCDLFYDCWDLCSFHLSQSSWKKWLAFIFCHLGVSSFWHWSGSFS